MKVTPLTIPDLLSNIKYHDNTLNDRFINVFKGYNGAESNLRYIMKDIYNDSILLGKEAIGALLFNSSDSNFEDMEVPDKNLTNELLVSRLFASLNIKDIERIIKVI